MAVTKVTLLFQYSTNYGQTQGPVRSAGWSESYYDQSGSTDRSLRASTVRLATVRAALLGYGSKIVGARFQLIDPIGPSSVMALNLPGAASTAGDLAQAALRIRLYGVGVKNGRSLILRGIADDLIKSGEYKPDSTFDTLLRDFVTRLHEGEWRFRGRNFTEPAQALFNIVPGTPSIINFEQAHGLDPGDVIYIQRALASDGRFFGGRYQVATVPTGISITTNPNWTNPATTGGKAVKKVFIYPLFAVPATIVPVATVRKTGRPFDLFVGRR